MILNNIYYNMFFLLAGHKVRGKKIHFLTFQYKKIVCDTGKTSILLVWLLPSLCSGFKFHTRIVYFVSSAERRSRFKIRLSALDTKDIFCSLYTESQPSCYHFACGKLIFRTVKILPHAKRHRQG